MPVADEGAHSPVDRFVVIGASNVSIGFSRIVEILRHGTANRCEILAAMGHGRSYGAWSRFLLRELPGIVDCGLWKALETQSAEVLSVRAIVTDVGNDLLYGFGVDQILGWVETCTGRLLQRGADVILTLPPLAAIRDLSRWRFWLLRTLFFPGSRRTLDHLLDSAERIADGLRTLGNDNNLPIVETPSGWYGFDPIHIRRRTRSAAWRNMFSQWSGLDSDAWNGRVCRRLARQLRKARPAIRRWRGKVQKTSQPALKFDGLSLSLY